MLTILTILTIWDFPGFWDSQILRASVEVEKSIGEGLALESFWMLTILTIWDSLPDALDAYHNYPTNILGTMPFQLVQNRTLRLL